jgi:hypothetical protein
LVLVTVPSFSGPGGGRQDDVGKHRRLGQEDVLHHEVIELGQRIAGVVGIRVRHRRVLAHDVHALDLAVVHGIHDLHDGEAGIWIELGVPQILELFEPSSDRNLE